MSYGIRNESIYNINLATIYYTTDTNLINNNFNDTINFKKLLTKKQIINSKKTFILTLIIILSISCGYIIFKRNNFKIICPNEYHYLLTDKQIEIFKNRVKTKYYLPCIPMYVSVDYLDENGYYSLFVNYGLYNYQFERNSDGLYEFRK